MRRLAIAAALLLSACSLPLPHGVHVGRGAPAVADSDPGDIQVMPPGPQAGAGPEAIVRGFLGAESSPDGNHQIARRFLTTDARWVDEQVQVYDPASLRIAPADPDAVAVVVSVSFTELAQIDPQGLYSGELPTTVTETYPLVRDKVGAWRISDPPVGVRLTPADRDRSFPAKRLYFLSLSSGTALHVIPDQVLLPVGGPPAKAELTRLLAGPSAALAGSATTAFPAGTTLVSVLVHSSGIYDVTLSRQVLRATDLQRQSLSAQLIWTLRGLDPHFRGLTINAGSQPLSVPGAGAVQRPNDWDVFDPEGLSEGPAYFLSSGRLHGLVNGKDVAGPPATRSLVVTAAAVTPDRSQIAAVLPGQRGQPTSVRRGAVTAAVLPVVLRAPGLASPSWGRGDRGLWLLDHAGGVLLLDRANRPRPVPVPGLDGPITALTMSRDGVRAAMVVHGGLYIGHVTDVAGRLRIVASTRIAPELTGVTVAAWRDPTTLVVLGVFSGTFLPVFVSVDGSGVRPLPVAGLPSRPQEVAASSLGILVTAGGRLYQLINLTLGFRPGPVGRAPAFPG